MLQNKVVKNASWIIGCKIVQSILGLVIGIFTARYLGPSGFGLISYALSVVNFVVPIMQLGLNSTLVHEIVNNPQEEGKIVGTAMLMNFLMSFVTIAMVLGFVLIANPGETDTLIVCALTSVLLIAQSIEIAQYWFQAKLQSKYISIAALVAYITISVYRLILLITNQTVYWFAISQGFDYFIIAIFLLIAYKKLGTQKLQVSFSVAKRLFSKSKFYIVSSLMVTIFAQTDKIMLKLMIDDAATGYYSIAVTCAGLTSFVFGAIIDSARPSIFESRKKDVATFERNVSRLYSVVIYLSLAQCIFMTLLARPIITLLYGEAYIPSIDPLRVVVWFTTFAYLGSVRNVWIISEGKQKYLWILNLCGAVLNISLNLLFINLWGLIGAAVASLITQVFTNIIMNQIIRPIKDVNKLMLKGLNPKLLIEMFNSLFRKKQPKEQENGEN